MTILDPHLDVSQVSAALDGETDPSVLAHLGACLACREQLDAWRRALAPLRHLSATPPDADTAVERAMAAWMPAPLDPVGPSPGASPGAPPPDAPHPGASETRSCRPRSLRRPDGGSRPDRGSRAGSARGERRLRPPPQVAAVLVLAVLVAGAVVGLQHVGGGHASSDKASSGAATMAPAAGLPLRSSAGALTPTHAGGSSKSSAATPVSGSATTGSATTGAAATGSGAADRPIVSSGSTAQASSTGPLPSFAGRVPLTRQLRRVVAATHTPAATGPGVGPAGPCRPQAQRLADRKRVTPPTPAYSEAVRLAGVRAQVYVFAGAPGYVGLVMRASSCSLLATVAW